MTKRIVVCADGTWNRPEKNPAKDAPTNVLRLARAVKPIADDGRAQQVFYDWGIGSYCDPVLGGATGKGINKNIMDDYRYIFRAHSLDSARRIGPEAGVVRRFARRCRRRIFVRRERRFAGGHSSGLDDETSGGGGADPRAASFGRPDSVGYRAAASSPAPHLQVPAAASPSD